MITASLDSNVFLILYGNTSIVLAPENFIVLKDGVRIEVESDCVMTAIKVPNRLCSISGSGTRTLNIVGYKHVNSNSLSDDINNGHPNLLSDDLINPVTLDFTTRLSGTWGTVEVDIPIIYYAAPYPPSIDISRIRGVLRSTGNDYYTMFTNANINSYSIVITDKISPYSAGDIIGYCPNAEGNFIIYKSPGVITVPWRDNQTSISFTILRKGKIDSDIKGLHLNPILGVTQYIPINYYLYSFSQNVFATPGTYSGNLVASIEGGERPLVPFSYTIIKEQMPITFTNGAFDISDIFSIKYSVNIRSTDSSSIDLFGKIRIHTSTGWKDWTPVGAGVLATIPPNSNNSYTYVFNLDTLDVWDRLELKIGNEGLVSAYHYNNIER